MAAAPLIVAAAGAAVSIYGTISGAKARGEAAQADAQLKREQADELWSRSVVNEGVMRKQGAYEQFQLGASFNGLAGGNNGAIIASNNNLNDAIINNRRDAEFKYKMLQAGADIDTKLASDVVAASYIGAVGTGLSTAANFYGRLGNFGNNSDLPRAPSMNSSSSSISAAQPAPQATSTAPKSTPSLGGNDQFGTQWWR